MKTLAAVVFSCAATLAAAQINPETLQEPPSRRWFSVDLTDTGAVAGGNLKGTAWAFHVRGADVKRLAPTTFSVGGVVLQVRAIPRSALPKVSTNTLLAHKKFEQDYQLATQKGIVFKEHPFCSAAKIPHQQWTATVPGDASGVVQAVVTFEVGDYVLMVSAPFENDQRLQAVARAMGDVCSTMQVKKIA